VLYYLSLEDFTLHVLDEGKPEAVSEGFAEFVGASSNGQIAFYLENATLFRLDLSSGNRIPIATGVSQETAWGVSTAGDSVFFSTGEGLRAWKQGELQHVFDSWEVPSRPKIISPNGRYALFRSAQSLTKYNSEGVPEFYRYDVDSQELVCASCRADGGKPAGPPRSGEPVTPLGRYGLRSVLDDGEVFFDTPDPLVPSDVNGHRDVYSFDGRNQVLISPGSGNSDSFFGDASANGRDVFFTTFDRLVKSDSNDDNDLYDARIGGGIPAQNAEPSGPVCSGTGCRGGTATGPPTVGSASESTSGFSKPASTRKAPHKSQCRKTKHRTKRRCVKGRDHKQRRQGR
jgi:hypothetical protein